MKAIAKTTEKTTQGMAVYAAAVTKLEPLWETPPPGDVVYRALPPVKTDERDPIDLLLLCLGRVGYYSEPAIRHRLRDARSIAIATLAATLSAVAMLILDSSDDLPAAMWGLSATVLFFSGGAALIIPMFMFSEKKESHKHYAVAQGWIESADMSGLVTVTNPDMETEDAIDQAAARMQAVTGRSKKRAQQRYYDLLCGIAEGRSGIAVGARTEQWVEVWTRWCQIDDAWTDLMCDPFAALTHSELLDVTLPRTAAFTTAFLDAKDLMHDRTAATVPVDLPRLAALVETAHRTWTEAHTHAEHAGYAWLPEAERKSAATAAKALTLAADEAAPIAERAAAAAKASALLAQIVTVRLPDKARTELDHLARKALPVATMTPILITEPDGAESSTILMQARETVPA